MEKLKKKKPNCDTTNGEPVTGKVNKKGNCVWSDGRGKGKNNRADFDSGVNPDGMGDGLGSPTMDGATVQDGLRF